MKTQSNVLINHHLKTINQKVVNYKTKPSSNRTLSTALVFAGIIGFLGLSACSEQNTASAPETPAPVVTQKPIEAQAKEDTEIAQGCGVVSIANMNWQSAELLANIDKIILEKGFGCEVELVPGDTVPTATSMTEKGKPEIAPELWLSAVKESIEKAVKDGRLHYATKALEDGGIEGWWVPKYVLDANPDIKTIEDALNHPELFPAEENKKKGAVHGCPAGWTCEITTQNIFNAWKAKDKGFILVKPGSAAALDGSIAKAFERKAPWLGYYWAPTSILGKYPLVKLDAGLPFDQAEWNRCTSLAECTDPKPNDWEKSEVVTVVTDSFKKRGGKAYSYLSNRSWKNDTVNSLLAWISENQANGEDGAIYFLKTQPDVWKKWVDDKTAEKISAGL